MNIHRFIRAELAAFCLTSTAGLVCCRCQPPLAEPPATVVSTGDASTPAAACAHLATVCSYDVPTCTAGVQAIQSAGLAPFDSACAMAATTKDAARLCAGIGANGCP
jgi:hypothetical protein